MAGCDGCSMCCKLLAIDEPTLKKPMHKWCQHCTKPGCRIYNDRPTACRLYDCVYIQSQTDANPLPLIFRPDKCKVVIDITIDNVFAICRVDPAYPKAMETPEMRIAAASLAAQHTVIVSTGKRKVVLYETKEGRDELRKSGLDDLQVEWYD